MVVSILPPATTDLEQIATLSAHDIENILSSSQEFLFIVEETEEPFALNMYIRRHDVTLFLQVTDGDVYVEHVRRGNYEWHEVEENG